MPIPKPGKKEGKEEFIGRCVSRLHDSDPGKPNKQIVAICHDAWRNKGKAPLTPQEEKKAIDPKKVSVWDVLMKFS